MIKKPYEHSSTLVHECEKKPKDWTYETGPKGQEWCLTIEDIDIGVDIDRPGTRDLYYFGVTACTWCGEKLPTIEEFEKGVSDGREHLAKLRMAVMAMDRVPGNRRGDES